MHYARSAAEPSVPVLTTGGGGRHLWCVSNTSLLPLRTWRFFASYKAATHLWLRYSILKHKVLLSLLLLSKLAIHHDIADSFQGTANRRHRDTALRREAQKKALAADEYHTLQKQPNSTELIQSLDAATTKATIYYIKSRFIR